MKRLRTEVNDLIKRGLDRQLRVAVTGLSRSGKTAFITAFVNQLLHIHNGARLPLFTTAREDRVLGVKRIPQRDFGIPRFAYEEGLSALYGSPPDWPTPTRGVSQIQLALRFRSDASFLRHLTPHSTLYLEIVDYPGEWLLDLPMLAQSYSDWSLQMNHLCQGERAQWAQSWLNLCAKCDPLGRVDENLLADIAGEYGQYLLRCKQEGLYFIQPGRFVLPGELAGAPALQFFPWPDGTIYNDNALAQADKRTNWGMLKARYDYYCQHIVKGFYREHFTHFDRQIVLVDCLQALNNGPQAFNDMRLALTQLMRSFQYGQRSLFRRLFSPCIDKLLFAASKADHITPDQHANLVALLQQLVQEAWQNAAFEGISIDCVGLASIQATESGMIERQGGRTPALKGYRLSDGKPITVYPGDVPARLPEPSFWQQQGFHFDQFRPKTMNVDTPLPHIRLDAAIEFLLGDKLR